ncbi:MAG: TolB protein [Candidatus Sumerlaeota bacterium]|nr:TolB protein [Candidatus Sumerlaeota bacterium]
MRIRPDWKWLSVCCFFAAGLLPAAPAFFAAEGKLLASTGEKTETLEPDLPVPIHELHGMMAGGRPLVTLGAPEISHGYELEQGSTLAILTSGGAIDEYVATDALRGYPSPSGKTIAVLKSDFSVTLWREGTETPLAFDKPVTLVAWSPDESKLCLTAYPEDWTPWKANNPESEEEFLRLIDSNLWLADLESGGVRQLTDAPGYDYSGVFTPDGRSLFFISSRAGRGAFFLMDLETSGLRQLTNLEPGSYDVPVGRSDTFVWLDKGSRLAYEAQEIGEKAVIRTFDVTSGAAQRLAPGTQPRVLDSGRLAYLDKSLNVVVTGKE